MPLLAAQNSLVSIFSLPEGKNESMFETLGMDFRCKMRPVGACEIDAVYVLKQAVPVIARYHAAFD